MDAAADAVACRQRRSCLACHACPVGNGAPFATVSSSRTTGATKLLKTPEASRQAGSRRSAAAVVSHFSAGSSIAMASSAPTSNRTVGAVAEWIADLGELVINWIAAVGDVALFSFRTFSWLSTRLPRRETILPCFYEIGVLSLPVIALTGTFIGMVLAAQSYSQFRQLGLETRLGAVINLSLVRELGPVLAATMLAGRVGSAMAAQLGTMRVTEQIDALTSMGANPIHYLVVPRFLGCLVLIPMLTIMADFMGVVGGAFYSIVILGIDSHFYWDNSQRFVGNFDLFIGIFKSFFFGAAIALISCHRGFHCDPGAEGVGRAATTAFVYSFVIILILDLFLGILLDNIYYSIWPERVRLL
jgi:phospholipid/cholesterol/gamma-HCH transport system permease protein